MYWVTPGSAVPALLGRLWTGDAYQEVDQGIWLPTQVRTESARVAPDGSAYWQMLEGFTFLELTVNQPVGSLDLVMTGPPLGTTFVGDVESLPPSMLRGRKLVWETAQGWLKKPPAVEPDEAFRRILQEYAATDVPAVAGGGR